MHFCERLKSRGVKVLCVGDVCNADLSDELRNAMTEYYSDVRMMSKSMVNLDNAYNTYTYR